jgi:hypothetical protein
VVSLSAGCLPSSHPGIHGSRPAFSVLSATIIVLPLSVYFILTLEFHRFSVLLHEICIYMHVL